MTEKHILFLETLTETIVRFMIVMEMILLLNLTKINQEVQKLEVVILE